MQEGSDMNECKNYSFEDNNSKCLAGFVIFDQKKSKYITSSSGEIEIFDRESATSYINVSGKNLAEEFLDRIMN